MKLTEEQKKKLKKFLTKARKEVKEKSDSYSTIEYVLYMNDWFSVELPTQKKLFMKIEEYEDVYGVSVASFKGMRNYDMVYESRVVIIGNL